MNALPRTRRWRKVAFALILAGTLLALFYAAVDWYAAREWAACQRSLRAQGEILDLSTLEGPPIPPARNLALLPFFTHWGSYRVDAGTGRVIFLQSGPTTYFADLPHLKADLMNVYPGVESFDLVAWQHSFQHAQPGTEHLDPAGEVLRALAPFQLVLSDLAAASKALPEGVFHREYAAETWVGSSPEMNLNFTLLLRANALVAAHRPSEALRDIETALWFQQATCGDPSVLLPMMLEAALVTEDYFPIRNGLDTGGWNDGEIAKLQGELSSLDLLADYVRSMRGERAEFLERLDRTWLEPFHAETRPTANGYWRDRWFIFAAAYGPHGWLDENKTSLAYWHQDLLGVCDPAAHRVYPERQRALDQRARELPFSRFFGNYVLVNTAYFLGPQVLIVADVQSRVDELVVRCALARYRLAHAGQCPATLVELTPRYLDHVPGGIRDGLPMRYQPLPDGHYQLAAEVAR